MCGWGGGEGRGGGGRLSENLPPPLHSMMWSMKCFDLFLSLLAGGYPWVLPLLMHDGTCSIYIKYFFEEVLKMIV